MKLKKKDSIINAILTNNCFLTSPVLLEEGYEIWDIGAGTKKHIDNTITNLEKLGRVEIKNIVKSTYIDFKLSKKQKEALELAYLKGYYEFPRRKDAQDLAKMMKISKATFLEHLRLGEIKIISSYLKSI